MDAVFTQEQRLFQRTVREFLEKESPPDQVREAGTGAEGWSTKRWSALANLGVVSLTIPERFGGLGKDERDLVLILEEAGRAALPEPLMETAVVIRSLANDWPKASNFDAAGWLERIAKGEAFGVYERTGGTQVNFFFTLYAIEDERARTSWHADGRLDADSDKNLDYAAFSSAAVLCGIADRVIEMAASYAKERQQFGKPIGSFQAVKHLLADALLGLDFARPAVYRAACSLATGSDDLKRDVSIAKALASDAAVNACRSALQVHGAIGYTHEHDLHLWLNKGFSLAHAWGTAAWHRERVARAVLG